MGSDLQNFPEEKEIGEHRADVAGRVQIVDQLRSDRRLRQHQSDGCLRGAGVDVNHADERAIGIARLKREPRDAQGDGIGEAGSGCWPRCPVRSEAPLGLLARSRNIQPSSARPAVFVLSL